jgi:hypothetical protein
MIGAAAIALPRRDIDGIDAILGVRRFGRPELRMCSADPGQEACADQYGSAEDVHFRLPFAFSFTPGSSRPSLASQMGNVMASRTDPSRKRFGSNADAVFPRSPRKTAHRRDGERIASAGLDARHPQIGHLE